MNILLRVVIFAFLLMFVAFVATAQEKEALSSDLLKVKIEQFEKTRYCSNAVPRPKVMTP